VNVGNCAICITAAPGALVEGNKSWLTISRLQSTVRVVDSEETGDGDLRGPATLRNNLACYATGSGSFSAPAGSSITGNLTRLGPNALTDACAR
jgi:hypothetical protein